MQTESIASTQLKTVLHVYSFDLEKPEDCEPYRQLVERLKNTPGRGHRMHTIKTPGSHDYINPGEIILEPEFLFENQWNSSIGRVFDWYEEAIFSPYNGRENKMIKRGHYLDITPEMLALRRDTLKCGYTDQQFPASDFQDKPRFNTTPRALGCAHLKESDLHLLRLLPVCEEFTGKRDELTDAERAFLLPLYVQAQTKLQAEKREKQIAEVEKEYQVAIAKANTEHNGKMWLLVRGINIENCIFYDHLGQFCFGWRRPLDFSAEQALKKVLQDFPFSYEIKTK